jgi:biotin carboxyl carrier protein
MDDILKIDDAEYHTTYTKKYKLNKYSPPELKKKEIKAFIPGQIVKIFAEKGKKIKAGSVILTFEAMKMINEIILDYDITVGEVMVKEGDNVEKNQILVKFKTSTK